MKRRTMVYVLLTLMLAVMLCGCGKDSSDVAVIAGADEDGTAIENVEQATEDVADTTEAAQEETVEDTVTVVPTEQEESETEETDAAEEFVDEENEIGRAHV